MPVFFSAMAGRRLGQPLGGWVNEIDQALQFARDKDADEFIECFLSTQRAHIRVVTV